MIQTTSPPAASRKWLRINGGRIRLPASCCWRIPPRISQIESSTKPPPAVISQAISAAHFITPSLVALASEALAERDVFIPRRGIYQASGGPLRVVELGLSQGRDSPHPRAGNRVP